MKCINAIVLLIFLSFISSCDAGQKNQINQWNIQEESGLTRWFAEEPAGLHFELVQRLSQQTKAFYLGRGFTSTSIDKYANSCIFHTTLANNSNDASILVDLSNWRVIRSSGEKYKLNLVNDWQEHWQQHNVSKAAQIAFRFSQLPNYQNPGPGDWFQGMISIDLEEGEKFDLEIFWDSNGELKNMLLQDLQCSTSSTSNINS